MLNLLPSCCTQECVIFQLRKVFGSVKPNIITYKVKVGKLHQDLSGITVLYGFEVTSVTISIPLPFLYQRIPSLLQQMNTIDKDSGHVEKQTNGSHCFTLDNAISLTIGQFRQKLHCMWQ